VRKVHERRKHECACECHGELKLHISVRCDCGRPICPPKRSECEPCPPGPACPPPVRPDPPGVVRVPQPDPPPTFGTSPQPPWTVGRPPEGDPGEIPWFIGQIGSIERKGPTFGPRKDEYLPFLVIRAAAGDTGARPFNGAFWESPDIFVMPDQSADSAPLAPPHSAGAAKANVPNTLYAHVWNLGKAPVYRARVEFYWFNPSLGIARSDANFIGAAWVDLGDRFTLFPDWRAVTSPTGSWLSRGCHAVVRCPVTWVPSYVNNGHECLVVRAFEPMMDAVPPDQFSASADRHIGQRNIAVVQAASPAAIDIGLDLGYAPNVGQADVDITVDDPSTMTWLSALTWNRDPGLRAPAHVSAGLLPVTVAGARVPDLGKLPDAARVELLRLRERFPRGCDPLRIGLHVSSPNVGANEAQVVRVRQRLDGDLIGGYTVVLIGK